MAASSPTPLRCFAVRVHWAASRETDDLATGKTQWPLEFVVLSGVGNVLFSATASAPGTTIESRSHRGVVGVEGEASAIRLILDKMRRCVTACTSDLKRSSRPRPLSQGGRGKAIRVQIGPSAETPRTSRGIAAWLAESSDERAWRPPHAEHHSSKFLMKYRYAFPCPPSQQAPSKKGRPRKLLEHLLRDGVRHHEGQVAAQRTMRRRPWSRKIAS